MTEVELIATAAFGLEAVVAREIQALGYTQTTLENGSVTFKADLSAICRANLWLRSADRLLIKVGRFPARSFDELFEQTKALPWPDWIPEDAVFPVQGKSIKSQLFSVPDCQAIVKKAVVEKMKQRYRQQWFAESGPRYTIEVALLKDVATLTLDTSGAGLHKRGYRKLTGPAPLKETLAAAMINLSRWHPDRAFLDPMCGSGTIPIEAALIGLNRAPGWNREFDAAAWPVLPARLWQQAHQEAADLLQPRRLTIRGTDLDREALRLARYHARLAGVEEYIHWQQAPLSELKTRQKYGYLICNPPYGQRLEDLTAVERLYRELGQIYQTSLPTWSCYVLTAHRGFERLFGKRANKKRKLYNGRIQCDYYQIFGPPPPRTKPVPLPAEIAETLLNKS